MPLDVLVNGAKVASLKSNQVQSVSLPAEGAELQVQMDGTVSSPTLRVTPSSEGQRFECGTPLWVLFDALSFCYLPFLRQRVFFLRPSSANALHETAV